MNFIPGMQGVAGLMRSMAAAVGMPVFRAAGTGVANKVSTLNVPLPAGNSSADYDILLIVCNGYSNTTFTVPAGWDLITKQSFGTNNWSWIAVYGKRMTGAESSPVAITISSSVINATCAQIMAFTGVHGFAPFEGIVSGSQDTSPTPSLLQVTTNGVNRLVLHCSGISVASNLGTPASGWTEQLDFTDSSNAASLYVQSIGQAAAGVSPAGTWALSSTTPTGKVAFALLPGTGSEVPVGTAWDPATKPSQLMLSEDALTVTDLRPQNQVAILSVRSTTLKSTGKWYYEVKAVTRGTGDQANPGGCNASFNLTTGMPGNGNSFGFSIQTSGTTGYVRFNNNTGAVQGGQYLTAGDTLGVAIDIDAHKMYLREATWWSDDLGNGGDPGASGPGWDYGNIGPMYISSSLQSYNGTPSTLLIAKAPFTWAVPSGYTAWG